MKELSQQNTDTANEEIPIELEKAIQSLKREMNAVILAHYYQESEIQDIADFVGDSLELSKRAANTNADVIIFAGVHFMAETAKILSPQKQVLLPDMNAGCSLDESCPPQQFKEFRETHPNHVAVSYINCSAEVKALSDYICTSSNAEKIINAIPVEKEILFAPDRNLGKYLMKKTKRAMTLWQGSCIVHETFSEKKILELRREFPSAHLIAHPECDESLLSNADFIGSTSALLKYVSASSASEFIVATEVGIIHQMEKSAPHKKLIPAPPLENCSCNTCPYMKLNTMEKLYLCMKHHSPEIILSDELIRRALVPLQRMMQIS
ncbi:MAG: quinolinate synthase NadA [Bacteroidota bacterium]